MTNFYTSLSANNIMAKLTNHIQRTRLITPSTDKHCSLDSEDDFRSGCRNVSHQQQFFSELLSPGRSHNTNYLTLLYVAAQNERQSNRADLLKQQDNSKSPQLTKNKDNINVALPFLMLNSRIQSST